MSLSEVQKVTLRVPTRGTGQPAGITTVPAQWVGPAAPQLRVGLPPRILRRVEEFVEMHLGETISLDALARMSLRVRSAGGTLQEIDDADWDHLPDLGAGFTADAAWRHEVARLGTIGLSASTSGPTGPASSADSSRSSPGLPSSTTGSAMAGRPIGRCSSNR